MPAKKGDYLGGIRTLEDIRLRCVCSADGCWHFRTARGRPMPTDRVHTISLHGHGHVTLGRAVWLLSRGRPAPKGRTVFRTCDSYDCANPEHLKCDLRRAYVKLVARRSITPARLKALRDNAHAQAKLTPELRGWLAESTQSGAALAHAFDMSPGRVRAIRREMFNRPNSVFQLAQVATAWRAAA